MLAKGYYAHTMDTLTSWRAFDPQDVIAVHWYHDGPPLGDYLDAINQSAAGHQVWLTEIDRLPTIEEREPGRRDLP